MDTYHLNLSWSELDSLKAAAQAAINDLEKCHDMVNERLDHPSPPSPEDYAKYLGYLDNVSRDKRNLQSVIAKIELSHD